MRSFRQLLVGLSVLLGAFLSVSYIANLTVLSPPYISRTAQATGFYPEVSKVLPELISPGTSATALLGQSFIQETATPRYVERKFEKLLEDLKNYFYQEGPTPVLSFADIAVRAEESGFSIPKSSPIYREVVVSEPRLKNVLQNLQNIQLAALIAFSVFLLLVSMMSPRGKKLFPMALVLFLTGLINLIFYLTSKSLPSPLLGMLSSSHQFEPIAPALRSLGEAVGQGAANHHLYLAAILAGAGILISLAGLFTSARAKFRHS